MVKGPLGIVVTQRLTLWAAALACLVTAGAVAQPRPIAPKTYDPATCWTGPIPAAWSERRRIVHLAVCEWSKFNYPVIEIVPAAPGAEARLPGGLGLDPALRAAVPPVYPQFKGVVAALERQVRFGYAEDDPAVYDRIRAYWEATDPDYAGRIAQVRRFADRQLPLGRGEGAGGYYPGWWTAWSGAFVSWTMHKAGAAWFEPNPYHTGYLRRAAARRPGALVLIDAYRPAAGDLICFPRPGVTAANDMPTPKTFRDRLLASTTDFPAHCDIVVRVGRAFVTSIGGNTRNAVAATLTPLDRQGRLVRSNVRPWALALKVEGPADPCARIEAVPTANWKDQGAARRRALARTGCAG
jgi:hypothetical protein